MNQSQKMSKLRIFVSSVQIELENERVAVLALISTDPFLHQHCETVLYEYEPASPDKALEGCLRKLGTCDVYLGIIWKEYGQLFKGLSATHQEYRHAKEKGMPVLLYIKGPAELPREGKTQTFLSEIHDDGFKHKRFGNFLDLQKEARASLVELLKERYHIEPSTDEDKIAAQTIEAMSNFENQALKRLTWQDLAHDVARILVARFEGKEPKRIDDSELLRKLVIQGLIWMDGDTGIHYATAAGIVILGKNPSAVFPQCRFLCDAYRGAEADGDPMDQADIRKPLPLAIDEVITFLDRNMRHPIRIVGLDRVRLNEYPHEALREALINSAVHRDYENSGRKILVEKFNDRIVISSPGMPPHPLTLAKLRAGKYRPCSRNPILAQCLSYFHRIEERGSGFRRMRDQMIDHGLEEPLLDSDSGYFQVIFKGPGEDVRKLRVPLSVAPQIVTPSIEKQLNARQKKIITHVLKSGSVTSGWCRKQFSAAYLTVYRDLTGLMKLGVLEKTGEGRSTKYILKRRQA